MTPHWYKNKIKVRAVFLKEELPTKLGGNGNIVKALFHYSFTGFEFLTRF